MDEFQLTVFELGERVAINLVAENRDQFELIVYPEYGRDS